MHDNANFCCPPRGGAGRRNGHNQLPKIILGVQFETASRLLYRKFKPPPDPSVTKIRR